jgi:hypothetical protein
MVKTQPDEGDANQVQDMEQYQVVPIRYNQSFIEPSMSFTELSINSHGDPKNGLFENHSTVNKYSFIAMNPPFGVSGKTAMEHGQ